MINNSKKETFLESIDHLLSIIDKYNIKTIAQQVNQLQILKEHANKYKKRAFLIMEMLFLGLR